jgi:hypothetical protein
MWQAYVLGNCESVGRVGLARNECLDGGGAAARVSAASSTLGNRLECRSRIASRTPSPAVPTVARTVPRDDATPSGDPVALKARARAAWQAARQRGVLPPAVCDKLWADGLMAVRTAPVAVAAIMLHRSEVLFSLISDRAGWLAHEDTPPPAVEPHPKLWRGVFRSGVVNSIWLVYK